MHLGHVEGSKGFGDRARVFGARGAGTSRFLHTHEGYGGGAAPWYTSLETDGVNWSPFNGQMFTDGPCEMQFDATHGILYYSSNWGNGLLALEVH